MPRFSAAIKALVAVGVSAGVSAAVAGAQVTQQPPTRLPAATIVGENARLITVQNDRHTAVTLFIDAGRVDRAIGTIEPGAVASLELPEWALRGQRSVKVVARAERENKAVATYSLPVNEGRQLGLLVPPKGGLPAGDSLVVTLPKGSANAATVTVSNQRNQPVAVYAEKGLMFVRLGDVAANQQGTLVVPTSLTKTKGELRVFARPEGAASISTKGLRVEQGDHIAVIVM